MADNITFRREKTGLFNRIPWAILLIVYLVAAHVYKIDMAGMAGYVFIGCGVVVLFFEFFKSGDISSASFLYDLLAAVVGVAVATGLLTYLVYEIGQAPTFYQWFGYAIIVGDAVMSPFNAFRTALRNIGVGN